jgi:hypothetical protein
MPILPKSEGTFRNKFAILFVVYDDASGRGCCACREEVKVVSQKLQDSMMMILAMGETSQTTIIMVLTTDH